MRVKKFVKKSAAASVTKKNGTMFLSAIITELIKSCSAKFKKKARHIYKSFEKRIDSDDCVMPENQQVQVTVPTFLGGLGVRVGWAICLSISCAKSSDIKFPKNI